MIPISMIRATIDDIPHIQQVAASTWPNTFRDILTPEQIAYMMDWMYATDALQRQITEQGHRFLLALQDTVPVGFASYELDYTDTHTTKIHKLYVCPDVQGRGVGRVLVNEVRRAAQGERQRAITLNVNRYNRAIQFYERLGFRQIATEDIDIGNGYYMNDAVMELLV